MWPGPRDVATTALAIATDPLASNHGCFPTLPALPLTVPFPCPALQLSLEEAMRDGLPSDLPALVQSLLLPAGLHHRLELHAQQLYQAMKRRGYVQWN